jgi:hypothetical protein
MNAVKGISFEKDTTGANRYIRIDIRQHEKILRPLLQQLGITEDDEMLGSLTSEEFLSEAKKLLRKKFDGRSKVS